ncbi:MAG: SDR family oxidoreductase [Rhodospirillaceae bacterium]|nr:SDR family oxidoreductase [Rhodospirillaceae bacterium]
MVAVGNRVILGYNVHFGLKSETEISDVFAVYKFNDMNSPLSAAEHFSAISTDATPTAAGAPGFERDFKELFRYYKNAVFAKFARRGPHLFMVFRVGKSVGEIKDSVDAVVDQHGKIDILMNCVGIQIEQPLLDVTEEAYDEVIEVNLKASMFLAQAVARRQIEAGNGGKQVHLLSVRAQLGIRKRGYSAYCSSKGGQVMLIKQHAMELAPHNINVNGVAPTFVYTEMIRHVMENDEFRQGLLDRIPLGRIADPKDIVGPAVFFSSPAADFVTAQIMYVDGGITASQ